MSKSVLLIGFSYINEENSIPKDKVCPVRNQYRELKGAIIDIYKAYDYFKEKGYQCQILCDFKKEPKSLSKSILEGCVRVEIFDFLENCSHIITYVKNKEDFIKAISNTSNPDIIYFSGHSYIYSKNLILPNGDMLKWMDFYKYVISPSREKSGICIILDCCYPPDFGVKYIMIDNTFVDNPTYNENYNGRKITIITSSEINKSSISSDCGSLFTRFLFEKMRESHYNGNIYTLKKFIESQIFRIYCKPQSIRIYSSHKIRKIIF